MRCPSSLLPAREFILALECDAVAIFVTANTDLLPDATRIQVYENAVGGAVR